MNRLLGIGDETARALLGGGESSARNARRAGAAGGFVGAAAPTSEPISKYRIVASVAPVVSAAPDPTSYYDPYAGYDPIYGGVYPRP